MGDDQALPWESHPRHALLSLLRTVWLILRHPRRVFEHLPAGPVLPAITFAALVRWQDAAFELTGFYLHKRRLPSSVTEWMATLGALLDLVVLMPFSALVVWSSTRALGGRITHAGAVRAICYAQACGLLVAPIKALGPNPPKFVILVAGFASLFMYGLALAGYARGRAQLSKFRARLVAFAWFVGVMTMSMATRWLFPGVFG